VVSNPILFLACLIAAFLIAIWLELDAMRNQQRDTNELLSELVENIERKD